MYFIHLLLMPVIFFIISIFLQNWLSKNEFIEIYKIYFLGIAIGLVTSLISYLLSPIYFYSAYKLTIFLKSIFIDGLLFIMVIGVSLYYIFRYIIKLNISPNFSFLTIMIFSFICGLYTFINFTEAISNNYPDYLSNYLPFLSYIILISIIIGFGYFKYLEAYDTYLKIFWVLIAAILFIVISSIYQYLKFYNSLYQYLLIFPAGILFFIFEVFDFRYFRK